MKKTDLVKIALEGVVGVVITCVGDTILTAFKSRKKEKNLDSSLVGDLTVAELKKILKDEA